MNDNNKADARAVSEIAEETKRRQRRHHSVHEQPSTHQSFNDYSDNPRPFSKSSSTSFAKVAKPEGSSGDSVNTKEAGGDKKLSKWCGLLASIPSVGSSRQPSEKPPKRRMQKGAPSHLGMI
ncbi:unnamed protein product [Litomosoides sigmodontis]|uniref:Uncharacterized protein n=1 Tax=Litomosoides sigmodontis TaxID=42156 RepID=A0A3P6TLA9_LITSI|nr:unnamed protein product [Litomosoides sigmodontis]